MGFGRTTVRNVGARGVLALVGYALFYVFGYTAFQTTSFIIPGEDTAFLGSVFLVSAIAARIVAYVLVLVLSVRRGEPSGTAHDAILAAVFLTGFLMTCMCFRFEEYIPARDLSGWLAVGGMCFGAADALLRLSWARFFPMLGTREAYRLVLLSNLISIAAYSLMGALPAYVSVLLSAAFFSVSVICARRLRKAPELPETSPADTSLAGLRASLRRLWQPILVAFIITLMSGFMLQVARGQTEGSGLGQLVPLLTQTAVIVLLFVPLAFLRPPKTLRLKSVFKFALLLTSFGFLLFPLVWGGERGISNACAQLGSLVAGIILWCLLSQESSDRGTSPLTLFPCAMGIISTASLIGNIAGISLAPMLRQGDTNAMVVALTVVYLVALVPMFILKEERSVTAGETDAAVETGDGAADPRVRALVQRFSLTEREGEIVELLGKGYSVKMIADVLSVSENTVKYHVKTVYGKVGVHTRDELIRELESKA